MKEFIDKEEYLAVQETLHKLMFSFPAIILNPEIHNINYRPIENIIYLDKKYMGNFQQFENYQIRTCKIINLNKPAMALVYNKSHKYFLKKKVKPKDAKELLQDAILRTGNRIKEISAWKIPDEIEIASLNSKIELCRKYLEKVDDYKEIAVSNYYKNYYYTIVTFKYQDPQLGKLISEHTHILKNEYTLDATGRNELKKEKFNIIFIDQDFIDKKIPYQNKKIVNFLSEFEKVPMIFTDLFLK